ncbi:MAG: hypothetical protein AVDCRST_MAG41-4399 [uncultured Corynebacteriales bacterium]|uniref:Uncharacterized protein n=1 Tax=uncultured Mycobacteriales bacterium TaxID=581187 RepID=A0A6J4JZ45_9ACTN|nr:MAG: hypothetical protein AVDCRST_MAG41-4399 [uncultured Corynebacteriales bacterium]
MILDSVERQLMVMKIAVVLVGFVILGYVVGKLDLSRSQEVIVFAVPLVLSVAWVIRYVSKQAQSR